MGDSVHIGWNQGGLLGFIPRQRLRHAGVLKVQAAGVDKLCRLVIIIPHGDTVSLGDEPGNVVLGNFGKRLV